MPEHLTHESWERLSELLRVGDPDDVHAFLDVLPAGETARAVSRLSDQDQRSLLLLLGPTAAAELFELLSGAQVVSLIEDLPADEAAAIVDALPSNEQADLLGDLGKSDATAILDEMAPAEAAGAMRLLQYEPDTAGGVMITEYVAYPVHATVGDVVTDLREHGERYSDYEIQYVYIVDGRGCLVGVLRLRDLLLPKAATPVGSLMIREPLHVPVDMPLEDLKGFFDEHPFVGVPVTDADGRLVGVVRRAGVEAAMGQRATQAFLAVSGLVGEDELRTMPVLVRSKRRLSWLSLNIVLNVIAASVIALYQETLAAVIALAVFLPIISDMSGCSGNQAVAVSIRELTLGLLKPYEFMRVVLKEGAVGILNGIVLGLLLGTVAVLWQGNVYLGLVVGAALMLNTLLAVLLGGLIPLALKSLKQDPALASGPILTTVTDMFGFLMVLSFATVLLGKLT
ncbi:MAG: magnesium transporter [Gemmatimonadota bacterium]|nr:MAG: magnesium transporter [Gemmatimonadota bacterium]